MRERVEGYVQALEEAGIPLNADWIVPSDLSTEEECKAMGQLISLPDRPKGVFANNNCLALGALLEINESHLLCPEEIALVGFDDHPWAAVSCPLLTVVSQPAYQIGGIAARTLLSLVEGESIAESQVLLDCELIVRESSTVRSDGA